MALCTRFANVYASFNTRCYDRVHETPATCSCNGRKAATAVQASSACQKRCILFDSLLLGSRVHVAVDEDMRLAPLGKAFDLHGQHRPLPRPYR